MSNKMMSFIFNPCEIAFLYCVYYNYAVFHFYVNKGICTIGT